MKRILSTIGAFLVALNIYAADPEAAGKLSQMEPVAENGSLALYIDPGTTEIAVRSVATGDIWFSNPFDRAGDRLANELNMSRLNSQLKVTVFTPRDQMLVFDTWTNSIRRRNFSLERLQDGIRVVYRFDNHERSEADIPVAVERKRFEERFLARMSGEEKELFLSRFKLDEAKGVYARFALPRFLVSDFLDILDRIGYTPDELEIDQAASRETKEARSDDLKSRIPGVKVASGNGKDQVAFSIPLTYRLEEDGLVVSVDTADIEYDKAYPIHAIEPLEFFGAAGERAEGYILVPDGSGALIRLNNGKSGYQPYSQSVYGNQDVELKKEDLLHTSQIYFPVYGLKNRSTALFAIIEEGDTIATVNADVSGRINSYNRVSAEFHVIEKGRVTLGTGDKARSKMIFQPEMSPGGIRIRYSFLTGADADYVGMARRYQKYLQEKEGLKPLPPEQRSAFDLELIGAITDKRSFAGIPFPRTVTLTSFRQALDIIDELLGAGIDSINLRYSGWLEGGVRHEFPEKPRISKALGGREGFLSLNAYLEAHGIPLFPDVSLFNVYGDGNGFSARRDAVRYLNQSVARSYRYNPATFQRNLEEEPGYYLSPARLPDVMQPLARFYGNAGIAGISFRDIAKTMVSDNDSDAPLYREEIKDVVNGELEGCRGTFSRIALEGGNAPFLGSADLVYGIPFSSSAFNIVDEDIPFNALVLHGFVRFAGDPVNLADDYRTVFLKTVETGGDLSFLWTYGSASLFKDTGFDRYFATEYRSWFDRAVELFRELDEAVGGLQSQRIVRHERLSPGVYLVGYSGGRRIVVNYNRNSVSALGRTVEGRDFIVLETEG